MKNEILSNINNPVQLERLYRADKSTFKHSFKALLPEIANNNLVDFWRARLDFSQEATPGEDRKKILWLFLAFIVAGIVAKLPALLHIDEEFFYTRNAGFIIFPILSAYFLFKNKLSTVKIAAIVGIITGCIIFINLLPSSTKSDTLNLSCIHLIVVLWAVLGFAFTNNATENVFKRLTYLKFNGDLVVITSLILIAGAILSGVTVGLFSLIGLQIEKFYFQNIIIFALPSAPILGTYLIENNPSIVGKISPVIARIFSPLVLIMLVSYLVAIIYSGKNPYNDREFLLMFNLLLIGVMAIIFFSIAETNESAKNQLEIWVLFLLSLITIIVNGVALSAILFRISEWGITPNRTAVLGGNLLILVHLLLVTTQLFRVVARKSDITIVGKTITSYLPIYCLWAGIVTFIFPFLFGFK